MEQPPAPADTGDSADRVALLEARLAALEQATAAGGAGALFTRLTRLLPLLAIGNLAVALPALAISIGVAYFSFVQAEATDKMQVASVWPRVTYVTSNQNESGEPVITMSLVNKGVGPAVIRGLEVRYRDKPYTGLRDLLADCCTADPESLSLGIGTVNGEVLRPGEDMVFAQFRPDGDAGGAYERFNGERLKVAIRSCYCSVFDDCWIDDWQQAEPTPVARCPADWVQYTGFPQSGGTRP